MGGRGSSIPRSVYPLLALLVVAALWLWRGGGEPAGPRRLFDMAPETIQTCAVRAPNGLVTLEHSPDGWRLGGAVPDLVDDEGVEALLEDLCATLRTEAVAAERWRETPETYGLDDRGIFEVMLTAAGVSSRVGIGAQNPATGLFYATGSGSDDLFMVGEDLVGMLVALPNSVRSTMLWPGFRRDDPDTLGLRFAGSEAWDLVARDRGGRWWLRAPADGYARIGRTARDYQQRYADRRRTEAGVDWLRLRDREIANLLSYLEDARVRDFLAPEFIAPGSGFGVRIPGSASHEVIFGELETENRVRAWRDGFDHGIVIPGEIVRESGSGLRQYLHTDLLDRGMATADSFAVSRAGLGEVRFINTDRGWVVSVPAEPADPGRMKLMAVDLVHFLDHVAIDRVYDPVADDPQRAPRTTLRIWATGPGLPPHTDIVLGLHADHDAPTAWRPADGRLAQVDRNLLITCQSVLMAAVGQRR